MKQVVHNAISHHLEPDAQPVPEPRSLFLRPAPPHLYTDREVSMVSNIPLASSGQLPWLCPLPASCEN